MVWSDQFLDCDAFTVLNVAIALAQHGVDLAGPHRFSDALLSTASPAH